MNCWPFRESHIENGEFCSDQFLICCPPWAYVILSFLLLFGHAHRWLKFGDTCQKNEMRPYPVAVCVALDVCFCEPVFETDGQ